MKTYTTEELQAIRNRLEAHAAACRQALTTYTMRPSLPEDHADLSRADLSGADLSGADLSRADLSGADLSRANLSGATGSELALAKTRILPAGSLVGWKKCRQDVIVKLRIPEEAKRSHAWGRKCRAEYADVIEVIGGEVGISLHDGATAYRAGERVTPDAWDEDFRNECSSGIHFFISEEEARAYN